MRGAALACCAGVVAFVGLVVVASVRPFAISVPTLWTTAMLRSSNDSACPAQAQRVGLDPSWPLQFVHVPKTAGTTIQDVLTHSAYERNVWFAMHDIYFESEQLNCTALVRTASILLGHQGFGYCDLVRANQRTFYLVSMRHPLALYVSMFDYVVNKALAFVPNSALLAAFQAWKGLALSDLVVLTNATGYSDGLARYLFEFARMQSRYLCGYDCLVESPGSNQLAWADVVARSHANLDRVDVLCIVEDLNACLAQWRLHLGHLDVPAIFPLENDNTRGTSKLSARAQAIVREWAKDDIALYERAVKRHAALNAVARRCLSSANHAM